MALTYRRLTSDEKLELQEALDYVSYPHLVSEDFLEDILEGEGDILADGVKWGFHDTEVGETLYRLVYSFLLGRQVGHGVPEDATALKAAYDERYTS